MICIRYPVLPFLLVAAWTTVWRERSQCGDAGSVDGDGTSSAVPAPGLGTFVDPFVMVPHLRVSVILELPEDGRVGTVFGYFVRFSPGW